MIDAILVQKSSAFRSLATLPKPYQEMVSFIHYVIPDAGYFVVNERELESDSDISVTFRWYAVTYRVYARYHENVNYPNWLARFEELRPGGKMVGGTDSKTLIGAIESALVEYIKNKLAETDKLIRMRYLIGERKGSKPELEIE